ncbi:Cytochrome P450 71A1 [Triticum urartu]|uniref:Cytochrome P450 71A1 n=1 Tax=Triticum urartu TaxID=4572 RepID=M8AHR7_TRIUA|nr:Cytochrome P450 71A1 [Triticum urartu]
MAALNKVSSYATPTRQSVLSLGMDLESSMFKQGWYSGGGILVVDLCPRAPSLRQLLLRHRRNLGGSPKADVDCRLHLRHLEDGGSCAGFMDDKLAAVLAEAQDLFAGFTIGDFFPELEPFASTVTGLRRRLKSCLADLREVCDDIVEEHVSGKHQRLPGDRDEDFVDVLLRVQKSPDLEVPLTDDNLKALVLDMFVAGTDTTFATLEWVMTELVRHPRILQKAQEEVRRVVGGKGRVEESDLAELHYMRAIIKETFRLHPAVPLLVPRETVAACTLGGYDIPAKTRVFINTFAMGRDPEIWEDPLEYSPERFEVAGAGGEIDLKDPDYKLLPFGGGRRGCPGYTFALATVQVSLASLLYHFEWALPAGVRAEDVSVEETFGLATRKKEPLFVAVSKSDVYQFNGEELNEV